MLTRPSEVWATNACPKTLPSMLLGPGTVGMRFTIRPEDVSTATILDSRSAVTSATTPPPFVAAVSAPGKAAVTRGAAAAARNERRFMHLIRPRGHERSADLHGRNSRRSGMDLHEASRRTVGSGWRRDGE